MIRSFGMSDTLAPLSYEDHDDNIFIGREMTQAKSYSEATAQKIDAEVALMIERAYATGKKLLEENIDILHALTDMLIEEETVMGPELDDLIAKMRPDFDFHGRRNVRTAPEPPTEEELAEQKAAEEAAAAEEADTAEADTTAEEDGGDILEFPGAKSEDDEEKSDDPEKKE
jgi:cell division protease FtsH